MNLNLLSPRLQEWLLFLHEAVTGRDQITLRLRKAGLDEITPLIVDPAVWCTSKHAGSVFQNAYEFYKANPDSIPFSDMLEETLPRVAAVLASISPRVRVRFETNDLKEA